MRKKFHRLPIVRFFVLTLGGGSASLLFLYRKPIARQMEASLIEAFLKIPADDLFCEWAGRITARFLHDNSLHK